MDDGRMKLYYSEQCNYRLLIRQYIINEYDKKAKIYFTVFFYFLFYFYQQV